MEMADDMRIKWRASRSRILREQFPAVTLKACVGGTAVDHHNYCGCITV